MELVFIFQRCFLPSRKTNVLIPIEYRNEDNFSGENLNAGYQGSIVIP